MSDICHICKRVTLFVSITGPYKSAAPRTGEKEKKKSAKMPEEKLFSGMPENSGIPQFGSRGRIRASRKNFNVGEKGVAHDATYTGRWYCLRYTR